MTMDLLVSRLLDGLNNGVTYAYLALALVCVYRSSGHANMAQGELAMLSGFLAFAMIGAGVPVLAAAALAIVAAMVLGGLIERLLVRPLGTGEATAYPFLLVTVGIFLAVNALAGVIWGGDPLPFPSLVPSAPEDFIPVLDSRLRYQQLLALALLVLVVTALYWFFQRTRLGLAMRATVSNPESAALVGVRVTMVNSLGWILASGVGALSAILVAPSTSLTTSMMFNFLIYGIAAASLGGFDSPGGAVVAGLVLGVVENLVAGYVTVIGPDLKQAVALVILIAVLAIRPTGIWGSKRVQRV
jgi:branched-chain amino acid transport system permease protein